MIRAVLIFLAIAAGFVPDAAAQPVVDNVLVKMVPPGATRLTGARMDLIRQSMLYRQLVAARSLSSIDDFASETGFDPRRDVRELLVATTPAGSVLLARGVFHLNPANLKNFNRTRVGEYDVWVQNDSGFCFLDSTLAVAGDLPAVKAALSEWKTGQHTAAAGLLARVAGVSPQAQLWGISTTGAGFLGLPDAKTGRSPIDYSEILRSLESAWLEVDLSTGFRAEINGTTVTEKDAISLRDALRGAVGMGRLQTPDNQPDLLRLWDALSVEQQGKTIRIRADIPNDLLDKLMRMLDANHPGGRG